MRGLLDVCQTDRTTCVIGETCFDTKALKHSLDVNLPFYTIPQSEDKQQLYYIQLQLNFTEARVDWGLLQTDQTIHIYMTTYSCIYWQTLQIVITIWNNMKKLYTEVIIVRKILKEKKIRFSVVWCF